jgi:phospholipid/cholesterol/gamma-HCH transport system permease protein
MAFKYVESPTDAIPIEPDGPYAGHLSRVVGYVPRKLRSVVGETGGMVLLLFQVIWSGVRYPRGYWADAFEEMAFTIRRSAVSIVVALFGFLGALSVPSVIFINLAGVAELYGPLLFVQSLRSFTVWVAALLVAGVVGAAMTAELGARKVREELDAMEVMGVDPIRTLVLPRVVSVTIVATLLAVPAMLITAFASGFGAWLIGGIEPSDFLYFQWSTLSPVELVASTLNCTLAGILIGTICCYKGLNAAGGAIGLGRAVNQAVVISFLSLFVMQLGYNAIVLGFFPGLGGFR